MKRFFLPYLAAVAAAVHAPVALGAPCCGAGSAAPTVISGDDAFQLSAAISHGEVVGDAFSSGLPVFRADGDHERVETLRLEGALLFSDRWQAGASLPLIRRERGTPSQATSSSTGLGDISASAAYEILPEWEYNPWKPRGFLFGQITLPTGSSIYDPSLGTGGDHWGLSARTRGFFTTGLGMLLVKSWRAWDASMMTELHRGFSRTFETPDGDIRRTPSWGGSLAVAGGYSPRAWPLRFGLALGPAYEGGVGIEGGGFSVSTSDRQLVWNASALVSWMATRTSTLGASYTDQTLVGPAHNAALNRTVALLFQKRWER